MFRPSELVARADLRPEPARARRPRKRSGKKPRLATLSPLTLSSPPLHPLPVCRTIEAIHTLALCRALPFNPLSLPLSLKPIGSLPLPLTLALTFQLQVEHLRQLRLRLRQ